MALEIIREDITRVKVDAIVNPTDEYYTGLGGTDGRIHEAAGIKLREACDRLPSLSAGECIVTDSFNMDNCRYIIHTVGPVYVNGHHNEAVTLARCYISVLREAVNLKVKSIALPLISTGTFGYPKKEALSIATRVIREFLYDYELDVYLLVYDKEAFDISRELYDDVDDYLSDYGFELESGYGDICDEAKQRPVSYNE
ncbi:MAG: macro domain-containing protein, partial [Solobacterium sp.]|nr:macro domain-containing protein [Solobacterium sp.]